MDPVNYGEAPQPPSRASNTVEIGYIHPLQVGKVLALMYAVLGLIFAPLFMIGPIMEGGAAAGIGIFVMLMMLVMYPVMGFIGGVISAVLYNFIARRIGGIRFDAH